MDEQQEQLILKKLDRIKDIPTLPTIVFEFRTPPLKPSVIPSKRIKPLRSKY
jgi:hypothetical protein